MPFNSQSSSCKVDRVNVDVLFFSRGRGKGHAVPDLSIIAELRRLSPGVQVAVASYSMGAEVFDAAGECLNRMELPENNPFADTVVCASRVLDEVSAPLVICHEEPAALPAAKLHGAKTIFLSHWFSGIGDPFLHSLRFADEVLFMERQGLFPEPDVVAGRVRYVGPVLRRFQYFPTDRERIRGELGFAQSDKIILMLPGNPSESIAPTCELVLGAYDLITSPHKRLIWIAGKDKAVVSESIGARANVEVIEVDWKLDRLMVACDMAITKGTYNISRELYALGIPSIALSYGQNFIDDLFVRTFPNTKFLWAKETDSSVLTEQIDSALSRGIGAPDEALLHGEGVVAAATAILEYIECAKTEFAPGGAH